MRCFILYRENPPETHLTGGYANPSDAPQLEGVVFSDGTVAVRWLSQLRSHSIWPDFETFEKVHGHPEYDSRIEWFEL